MVNREGYLEKKDNVTEQLGFEYEDVIRIKKTQFI